jgi:hypothetical protein
MEYTLPILFLVFIAGLVYAYGAIQHAEGYKLGKFTGEYVGASQLIEMLHDLKIVNADVLAKDFMSGKYDHNPRIKQAMAKIKSYK